MQIYAYLHVCYCSYAKALLEICLPYNFTQCLAIGISRMGC